MADDVNNENASANASESDQQAVPPEARAQETAPSDDALSGRARLGRVLSFVGPLICACAVGLGALTASQSGALSGEVAAPKELATVPIRVTLASPQLFAANCVGKDNLAGIEDSKIEYSVGSGKPLEAPLGTGVRSGQRCSFSIELNGEPAQLFGAVALRVIFPFADPISFEFQVSKQTPVVEVALSIA